MFSVYLNFGTSYNVLTVVGNTIDNKKVNLLLDVEGVRRIYDYEKIKSCSYCLALFYLLLMRNCKLRQTIRDPR